MVIGLTGGFSSGLAAVRVYPHVSERSDVVPDTGASSFRRPPSTSAVFMQEGEGLTRVSDAVWSGSRTR